MGRQKSKATRVEPGEIHSQANGVVYRDGFAGNGTLRHRGVTESKASANGSPLISVGKDAKEQNQAGIATLIFCVGGIYASFLTWAVLQERITTTSYGPSYAPEKFKYPVFLNTVQSTFAALSGLTYLYTSTKHPHKPGRPAPIFPTYRIIPPLLLVSITSSLASPFGYAALNYIDYVTFILAKSCKLLPVMALHLTIFRKKYPLYKYLVVALVTMGVAIFTLHHPSTASKAAKHNSKSSGIPGSGVSSGTLWGLGLLGINLLFDGLFNSTQDYIFAAFKPYSGPQMMCAQNIMSTLLTVSYLLLSPLVASTAFGRYVGLSATTTNGSSSSSSSSELIDAIAFVRRYPRVGYDVLAFSACGAVGQVFIFHTLATFSSLLLVTVNVTRKMLTMVLSVLWFGHRISGMQWVGVGLVFGGIGGEAMWGRREKKARELKAARAMGSMSQAQGLEKKDR